MRILALTLALSLAGCSESSDDTASTSTPTPLPTSVTQVIGPAGGQIVLDGATVTFPKDAVAADTSITITATSEAPPAGYVALSRVYQCEPSGLSFSSKVTMKMGFTPDGKAATMFWSSGADPAFKDVGGELAGSTMSAGVQHFSKGFVGRPAQ